MFASNLKLARNGKTLPTVNQTVTMEESTGLKIKISNTYLHLMSFPFWPGEMPIEPYSVSFTPGAKASSTLEISLP